MKTYFTSKPTYPLPEISGSWQFIKYPCVAEIKLDGEFNYLVGNGTEAILINKYGRVRADLPITNEVKGFTGILAGELYYGTGKSFFEEMLSHKFDSQLKFCAFDILLYGDITVANEKLSARRERLIAFQGRFALEHIHLAEQVICKDKPAVMAFYEKVVKAGYEGIVVKNDCRFVDGTCQSMMKLKHTETLDVYAVGYKKGKDAIAIGTEEKKPIGAVGNAGKEFGKALELVKDQVIIGEDKEYWYVQKRYCIEIKHLGVLKSGMLRNATMVRLRPDKNQPYILRKEAKL